MQKEFETFSKYHWGFIDGKPIQNNFTNMSEIPDNTLSDKINKDLKSWGFKFVGSTIVYAYLQSMGIVNDHTVDCFSHKEVKISYYSFSYHQQLTNYFVFAFVSLLHYLENMA